MHDKLILNNLSFSIEELLSTLSNQGVPVRIEGMNLYIGTQILRGTQISASSQHNGCSVMNELDSIRDRVNTIEEIISTLKNPNQSPSSYRTSSSPQTVQYKSSPYPGAGTQSTDPFKIAFESSYRDRSLSQSENIPIPGKDRTCSICGASIASRAIFCAKCGSNVRT
ncbi:MAG: zinc ribbon domain-containing protein [Promethearchaeota archaeon]